MGLGLRRLDPRSARPRLRQSARRRSAEYCRRCGGRVAGRRRRRPQPPGDSAVRTLRIPADRRAPRFLADSLTSAWRSDEKSPRPLTPAQANIDALFTAARRRLWIPKKSFTLLNNDANN